MFFLFVLNNDNHETGTAQEDLQVSVDVNYSAPGGFLIPEATVLPSSQLPDPQL